MALVHGRSQPRDARGDGRALVRATGTPLYYLPQALPVCTGVCMLCDERDAYTFYREPVTQAEVACCRPCFDEYLAAVGGR